MNDISQCDGKDCEKKELCYRYINTSETYISKIKGNKYCIYFWEIKKKLDK